MLALAGDNAVLDDWTDRVVAVATEQGFPVWRAQGTMLRGWVKVRSGDVADGLSPLRSGSTLPRHRSRGMDAAYFPGRRMRVPEVEEAVSLCDQALKSITRTDQR